MSELNDILKEEYLKQIDALDITLLMEMIEEAFEKNIPLDEEGAPTFDSVDDAAALSMILKMIPDIEVSEIGWSDVSTPEDGEEIKGEQRQLLEGYLKNIKGTDFADKIRSVSEFYTNGSDMIGKQAGKDRTKRIVQAISYLVFYKTLTKVITNFNASSAGFSFESFLAALVDGYQIKANTGTIADYIDRSSGVEIPVSLKLYKEGGLEVGGSYTDLVRDLTMTWPKGTQPWASTFPNAMRYVVCTKTLKGDGLEQEGHIDFYQFDFTLKNVMEILASSRLSEVIRIPQVVISALRAGQRAGATELLDLPDRQRALSAEELTPIFADEVSTQIKKYVSENPESPLSDFDKENLAELITDLNWEKNDNLFNNEKRRGIGKLGKVRVLSWVKAAYNELPETHLPLRDAIVNANEAVIISQNAAAKKTERNRQIEEMIAKGEFLSVEESARQYGMLGEEQQRQALLTSLGYLRTYHFSLNQTQAVNSGAPTNTIKVGSIMVGRQMVAKALDNVKELLNEEVYEIFQSLKILSDSLNQFFAGGLENETLAATAISNASDISSKDILKTDK